MNKLKLYLSDKGFRRRTLYVIVIVLLELFLLFILRQPLITIPVNTFIVGFQMSSIIRTRIIGKLIDENGVIIDSLVLQTKELEGADIDQTTYSNFIKFKEAFARLEGRNEIIEKMMYLP